MQGVSVLGMSVFLCSIPAGDNQSVVLLRCNRGLSVSFVEAWRVTTGIVFMDIRQIACGNTATLDVRRLAVSVAVLLVNVLTQFPPLPLFQHLRLHLRGDGIAKTK